MSQPAAKFDTLSYANALKKAGCSEILAEVHAEKQAEVIQWLVEEQLATKSDINELKIEVIKTQASVQILDERIQALSDKTQANFQIVDEKIQALIDKTQANFQIVDEKIQALTDKTQASVQTLDEKTNLGFSSIRAELLHLESRLFNKIVGTNTVIITALLLLVECMHKFHVL